MGFERAGRACLALASGLTPLTQMRGGVRARWQDFASDDEAIEAGLLPWETAFADRYLPSGARVLVIGCGSGRDVVALARRGYRVVGIDPAAEAVATGRAALERLGIEASLLDGFFEDRQWPPEFDAVSFSNYTYTYIPGAARRVAALTLAAAALRPGGHILLNVFRREGGERLAVLGAWTARFSRNDWFPGPGDQFPLDAASGTVFYEHFFSQHQLDEEFASAGLRLVESLDRDQAFVLRAL